MREIEHSYCEVCGNVAEVIYNVDVKFIDPLKAEEYCIYDRAIPSSHSRYKYNLVCCEECCESLMDITKHIDNTLSDSLVMFDGDENIGKEYDTF